MSILGLWSRRYSKICLAFAGLLQIVPSQAANPWLQIPLNVEQRLQVASIGVKNLHITDADGNELRFAYCASTKASEPREHAVEIIALPRGIDAELGPDGAPQLRRPPGVELKAPWERWLLDLRTLNGAALALKLPLGIDPNIVQLRSSPNLRQWSRALEWDRDGPWLRLHVPQSSDWLSVHFVQEVSLNPEQVAVIASDDEILRARQWHRVHPNARGVVEAPLPEPVRGLRVVPPTADLERIEISSRIKNSDAWKARGQWEIGQGATQILFNGIGDQQWKLQAFPAHTDWQWEMAHDARELRISGSPRLPLDAHAGSQRAASSACDAATWSGPAHRTTLSFDDFLAEHHHANDRGQINVLPWFLSLVGLGLSALYIRRKLRK